MEEVFNAGNSNLENIRTTTVSYEDGAEEELEFGRKPAEKKAEDLVPDEDGIIPFVDPDMLISDIIDLYPDASLVFMRCGMYCITCAASQMETLEQACAVHGLDPEDVAKVLNDYLTEQKKLAEEEAADRESEKNSNIL